MRRRNYQLRKARQSKKDEDLKLIDCSEIELQFKLVRPNAIIIRLIQDNSDSKYFWETMNKILPNYKKKNITSAINIDGNLISDKSQVANAFNSYFTGSRTSCEFAGFFLH